MSIKTPSPIAVVVGSGADLDKAGVHAVCGDGWEIGLNAILFQWKFNSVEITKRNRALSYLDSFALFECCVRVVVGVNRRSPAELAVAACHESHSATSPLIHVYPPPLAKNTFLTLSGWG